MNLGENIYRLRTERRMSQGDLADALDVSRQSVSKWENNSATPDLEKLLKMSQLFDVTLDQLVGRQEPTQHPPEPCTPELPVRRSMPFHRVLGIILLCFGLAVFLILTFLGGILAGFFFGVPLIIVGSICLLFRNNLAFKCCWGIFMVFSPVITLFSLNFVMIRITYMLIGIELICFAALIIWTIIGLRSGKLRPIPRKTVLMALAAFVLCAALTGLIISSSGVVTRFNGSRTEVEFSPQRNNS